jgi:hypothetical protein
MLYQEKSGNPVKESDMREAGAAHANFLKLSLSRETFALMK